MNPLLLIVIILAAQASSPIVAVHVDRSWYSPGDLVAITVQVNRADDENPTARWLWLYIDKPDGHNALFAQLRFENQTYMWSIPADASDGTYTVTVTWHHEYTQTGFIVSAQPIPEFPFAFVVLLVALTTASLALSRWKTSARPRATADDSGAHDVR